MKRILILSTLLAGAVTLHAQLYTGISGLIHVPSAEMNKEGNAQVGMYFLNKEFTPDGGFSYNGDKYNTTDYYLSITPIRWVEVSYTFTLQKSLAEGREKPKFNQKDRYFSVKISPIQEKEGKWWPSVAVGSSDFLSSGNEKMREMGGSVGGHYFRNYYGAVTKHFNLWQERIGVTVAYRKYKDAYNEKWNGVVGGLTYRPSFAKSLRVIAEYTGEDVNVGADCLLWRHLLLQASLQDGKYFSGGVCYRVNLLGRH